jgi:hypothetical protein
VIAKRLREREVDLARQRVVFESRKVLDAGEAMRDLQAISELEGEVRALAWTLALSGPKPKGLVGVRAADPAVQLEPVPGLACWLLEIAADPEPGFGNRQWGALLSDGQVGALAVMIAGLVGQGSIEGDAHAS